MLSLALPVPFPANLLPLLHEPSAPAPGTGDLPWAVSDSPDAAGRAEEGQGSQSSDRDLAAGREEEGPGWQRAGGTSPQSPWL